MAGGERSIAVELLNDVNGHTSSKRTAGLMLVGTACLATFQCIEQGIHEFAALIIGIATIGAGLLGSTMVEKVKK